jgi:hypothetical protein
MTSAMLLDRTYCTFGPVDQLSLARSYGAAAFAGLTLWRLQALRCVLMYLTVAEDGTNHLQ